MVFLRVSYFCWTFPLGGFARRASFRDLMNITNLALDCDGIDTLEARCNTSSLIRVSLQQTREWSLSQRSERTASWTCFSGSCISFKSSWCQCLGHGEGCQEALACMFWWAIVCEARSLSSHWPLLFNLLIFISSQTTRPEVLISTQCFLFRVVYIFGNWS